MKGEIDAKRLKEIADVWGKLPEKERAKAMLELTRDLPPRYRETIETYLKKIATQSESSSNK
jgi:acyl-CoA hydrolase